MQPISIKASFLQDVGEKIHSDCYCGKASSKSEKKAREMETKAPGEQGVALGCEGANEHCCLLIAARFS